MHPPEATAFDFLELHTPNSGYGDSLRTLPGFDQELV